MKPTVGRIVHYKLGSALIPAVITRVWSADEGIKATPNPVALCTFDETDGATPVRVATEGERDGDWRWPARDVEELEKVAPSPGPWPGERATSDGGERDE